MGNYYLHLLPVLSTNNKLLRSVIVSAYGDMENIRTAALKGCIFRPSSIIGENAPGNLSRMIKLIDFGIIPLFNGGKNRKSLRVV